MLKIADGDLLLIKKHVEILGITYLGLGWVWHRFQI